MSEFAAESVLGTWGGELEFRWEPNLQNPRVIANRVEQLGDALRDMSIPMIGARQIAMDDIEEHFRNEEGPDGEAWVDWSPNYTPEPGQEGKLKQSGALMDAATDERNYLMVPEGFEGEDLFVNPFAFPIYWHIHNVGGESGYSGTVVIPARPYLGISEEAQAEIIALFDLWMGDNIRLFTNPITGQTQTILSTPRGPRFGRALGRGSLTEI